MSKTVSATFRTAMDAREALINLEIAGIKAEQISVLSTDNSIGHSFNIEKNSKAAEGGSIGASAGGIIGAIAAGLAATGTILIPGVNVVAYGALVAAAAGAGVGAAAGGLTGALVGMGIPEYEAKRYEDEIKNGAVLLVIEADDSDQAERIEGLLERHHAKNIAA